MRPLVNTNTPTGLPKRAPVDNECRREALPSGSEDDVAFLATHASSSNQMKQTINGQSVQ